MLKQFKTLADLYLTFSDNKVALEHFKSIRWRDGEFCPYCGHDKIYTLKANRYQCAQCRNTFSILVGTIFENTKLKLRVWFGAIWLLTNHPKGIASTTLAKDLGVTQKTAWFILHRLRHAARTQSFNSPLSGTVEVDETYVGGKSSNRHKHERRKRKGKAGVVNKTPVIGAAERGGDVVARVANFGVGEAEHFIKQVVSPSADLIVTDAHPAYAAMSGLPQHEMINHHVGEYVRGAAHTNTIESVRTIPNPGAGFWVGRETVWSPSELPDWKGPIPPVAPGQTDFCAPLAVPSVGNFIPLVRNSLYLACDLDILFLRHDDDLRILRDHGDLDNRIKTLFDGLKKPTTIEEQGGIHPSADPLYVLLEDDALIHSFSVRTGKLLGQAVERRKKLVRLTIDVTVKVLRTFHANECLLGG